MRIFKEVPWRVRGRGPYVTECFECKTDKDRTVEMGEDVEYGNTICEECLLKALALIRSDTRGRCAD